jgi:3-oxoacid CoA-transferase
MLFSKLARTFSTSKIYTDPVKALEGIKDGSFILVGGFGFCGVPMNLVNALRLKKVQNLTIASNSCGVDGKDIHTDWGLSMLLRTRQIKRLIFSHLGDNVASQQQYFNGELELEVCPQGTLAEKFRSGGSGIPAFYTPTGVDTIVETGGYVIKYKKTEKGLEPEILSEPKPSKVFNGRKYIE